METQPFERPLRDSLPTASLTTLRLRAGLRAALRRFFERHGYLEVETPILSHDVVVDAHLEPFVTRWDAAGGGLAAAGAVAGGRELFLQTSPEFGMKRLLAAGATAIYQVTRGFRNGERGRLHNPEFTLIEWYRTGDTHHDQMDFAEELVASFFAEAERLTAYEHQPEAPTRDVDSLARPFSRITYDDAFAQFAGSRVLDPCASDLAALAARHGIAAPPGLAPDDRDGWLNLLLAELVEPRLGVERPTFLYDYPASQGALARLRPDDPRVAERFELYIQGVEICNGYHELLDADELRRRMGEQAELRRREGRRALPMENRLLEAMESGLPACSGVALGFDRLLMAAVGAGSLDEVTAFPIDRA
ncbi:MAG TPA: EF-P lysine aminoacylase EpmA [Planctomycetaceae bacterium]|nr:EF-P lysine aminoacylase EpmA [Planctomycetaceae bacterium]